MTKYYHRKEKNTLKFQVKVKLKRKQYLRKKLTENKNPNPTTNSVKKQMK